MPSAQLVWPQVVRPTSPEPYWTPPRALGRIIEQETCAGRNEQLVVFDRVIIAAGAAQAENVPVALELDRISGVVDQNDFRMAGSVELHVFAVGDEAAGMDPFGMIDRAAVAPDAFDQIPAIDRLGIAAWHTLAGDGHVCAAGVDGVGAFVGQESPGRCAHDPLDHHAPTG